MKNIVDPNLMDVQCENLKLTEIIYKDDDVGQLVEFLLRFSRNLPNNNIRLIKIDWLVSSFAQRLVRGLVTYKGSSEFYLHTLG